ncbi:MAG: signal recognition particle-docking protein FtsY [Oligoflexia bacterium]|nr:signal recognition particle-docking protein FtsY [Oligoflexia bacterium]
MDSIIVNKIYLLLLVFGFLSILLASFFLIRRWILLRRRRRSTEPPVAVAVPTAGTGTVVVAPPPPPPSPPLVQVTWHERMRKGLARSRTEIWGKIDRMLGGQTLSKEHLDELEGILYAADLGPKIVQELIKGLSGAEVLSASHNLLDLKKFLFTSISQKMEVVQNTVDDEIYNYSANARGTRGAPKVIMVVGVNGAGKTTTIGKMAQRYAQQGAKVVVGAADTFRAAAVDQLAVWCERAQAQMIRAKEGSDPSGVAYEALAVARREGADYCIIDTAGRLHTKVNLMEELKKNKRVLSKLDDTAPHHTLLVIDAVTGQNALKQAQEFNSTLGVTGLVFTKCDGSSKAGSAVGIIDTLQLPIYYIGVGEGVEDLDRFDLQYYLSSLLDINL